MAHCILHTVHCSCYCFIHLPSLYSSLLVSHSPSAILSPYVSFMPSLSLHFCRSLILSVTLSPSPFPLSLLQFSYPIYNPLPLFSCPSLTLSIQLSLSAAIPSHHPYKSLSLSLSVAIPSLHLYNSLSLALCCHSLTPSIQLSPSRPLLCVLHLYQSHSWFLLYCKNIFLEPGSKVTMKTVRGETRSLSVSPLARCPQQMLLLSLEKKKPNTKCALA